ncbi:MAG: adenine deaminase [Verrucomicrobia bacterium]|nr:adenine deaminase [Verrucomicrobiota bacterium]MBS0636847.1 adenine deaminase [Verrucomicrobiota bacterium]
MDPIILKGKVVDVVNRTVFPGRVFIADGEILAVEQTTDPVPDQYIMPGFIDAHVHVESSMLVPSEFARMAVVHGTVATVSDPHEIANVLGYEGVKYMIDNAKKVPFHFYFGAPSCVPATTFETAGANLTAAEIRTLFEKDGLRYLSEMMNYPGVLNRDPMVMEKINVAKELGLPIDGHAPGLRGKEAEHYIAAGISTDHECYSLGEAVDKAGYGMMISIREGSAAKNYEALHPLFKLHPDKIMFCSDDKHPNDLVVSHIDELVRRSIVDHGYDTMDVLQAACITPRRHYRLDVGQLLPGDSADFIVVNNLHDFTVLQTYVKGILVAERGKSLIKSVKSESINNFNIGPIDEADIALKPSEKEVFVIKAFDGQLITDKIKAKPKVDTKADILKLVVVNRYNKAPPAVAFIQGFGLKKGALASCIAHDSHNIIAVGVDDASITRAINAVIANKGGIATDSESLALPVAGIMTQEDGYSVAKKYSKIDAEAKKLGTTLHAPFMTLSFMALLVIPSLKLSDKGLFDGTKFTFVR